MTKTYPIISNDEAIHRLERGSFIERVGSFYPPARPGFGDSKHERNISRRVAEKLYSRRVKIAQHFNSNSGAPHKEKCISALVSAGISPHSVSRWDDYIELLVSHQGGWTLVHRELEQDFQEISYLTKSAAYRIAVAVVLYLAAVLAGNMYGGMIHNYWMTMIMLAIPMALFWVYYFFVVSPILSHLRKAKKRIYGKKKKDVREFYPYYRVV